ncbi:MAG: NAD(P)H-dependent oxidoreductase [Halobacteriales archaeon]|nr:NAD(P)H-dependent oxidoreductase [Halobacteriales archaeon]
MSDPPHVVAVCGSLREASYTRVALERALEAARGVGATAELLDLREFDLPVFDADERDAGDADELTAAIRGADAVLLGTPMYHGSFSSALKNALDYCGFDEFEDTTVGLLAVAGGSFPVTALEHLRSVCRSLNAWVLPYQAAVPSAGDAIEDGEWRDADLEERVAALGRRAVRFANIEPDPTTFESGQNVGADD